MWKTFWGLKGFSRIGSEVDVDPILNSPMGYLGYFVVKVFVVMGEYFVLYC